ncbi:MAG TPA: hypothetical protein DCE42_30980 [Myxococcales bacterium]|nr:hypothetical protein [Deltaproteobacteria bacterium]HAA59213.1 hypothetical protein [Myxococcales bacterium]|tara:strand:- start:5675 stop:6271 length:597 start_codon:yes stop_codon:yes gene_type:complete
MKRYEERTRWTRVIGSLLAAVLLFSSPMVWALPQKTSTHKLLQWSKHTPRKVTTTQVSQAITPTSSAPAYRLPQGALILEGVGVTVAGIGAIIFAVGRTNIGLRNQLACVGQEDAGIDFFGTSFGGCVKGSAREAKELEDSGIMLLTVGSITMGVGAAALVIGTIWLLADQPKNNESDLPKQASSQNTHPITFVHIPL